MADILNVIPEGEAKEKWCRHAHGRVSCTTAAEGNRYYADRGGGPMFCCLGTRCMAWVTERIETEEGRSVAYGYCGAERGAR